MSQSLAQETMQVPPLRRRNWMTWAAGFALLFGAYLLAGFYLAPRLIRAQATLWVQTNLNKSIAIGDIKVNPLSFKVDISDIAIPAATVRWSRWPICESVFRLCRLFKTRIGSPSFASTGRSFRRP